MEKEFDQESLSGFDGRDGKAAYVARDGVVYDVSESRLWKNGEHMKRHQAGRDLSADISAAPHGEEVFERVTRVGTLAEKTATEKTGQQLPPWLEGILERYPLMARHPHPMLVHFPIAFMFAATLFSLLALITGTQSFETTAYHCLGAGLLFTPLTIATGFFTWWINYQARLNHPIRMKIFGSLLLLVLNLALFTWRVLSPDILPVRNGAGILYLALLFGLVPVVSVVGWYGAALTFPTHKKK